MNALDLEELRLEVSLYRARLEALRAAGKVSMARQAKKTLECLETLLGEATALEPQSVKDVEAPTQFQRETRRR